jgi:hypothetical protein
MSTALKLPGIPVRLLPLAPAPFAVCLLRRAKAKGTARDADPFLRTSDAGNTGDLRAYPAILTSETGAVLAPLLVELPSLDGEEAVFPGEEPPTSVAIEADWAAARRDLQRLLAEPDHFPELVLPGAATEAEGEPPFLPPLFFCPTAGRLFPIPCPRCGGTLHTCRDEARLAAAGLPSHSATSARFLACPDCAGKEEESAGPRFWAATPAEARGLGEAVGSLDDLRRELAVAPPPEGSEAALRMPDTPPADWIAWNVQDSPYLVTRMAPLSLDVFLERLGGGREEEGEEPGLLFAAEGSGIDAVEVLALKLAAFLQMVGGLRRHYLLLGRPHLDLHPDRFAVEPGPRADFLPHLWSFRVKLLGASAGRSAPLGPDLAVPLPPLSPRAPFAAETLRAARLASPSTAELLIERVTEEKKTKGLWRITGTLVDPHGFYPPPGPRDWIQLAWPRDPFGPGRAVAARLDPQGGRPGIEASLTTEPMALEAALAKQLGRSGGYRVPGVRYRIYPALDVPEDLYSLGVLLLRILLVNDGQALSALEPLLDAIPQGTEARGARASAEETLDAMRDAAPESLAKANLFHRAVDRIPERPNAVPDDLWTAVLLFALRLVARGPGFGLSPEPDGTFAYDATHPVAALDAVRAEAADLLHQLHAVLFERQAVHAEIQAVLTELLAEEQEGEESGARL